jgi:2-isopropylmalate synthase
MEFFRKMSANKLKSAKLVAFSMTKRTNILAENDANLKSLLKAGVEIVTIVGKTWDLHVREVLKVSLEENIQIIKDTVRFLTSKGLTIFYDAEHFFDAFRTNRDYSLACLAAAIEAGAETLRSEERRVGKEC